MSRLDECAKLSNFSPAERRRMAEESGVDDLPGQVRHQELIRRSAKTGKIIEDLRVAREWSNAQAWIRSTKEGASVANRKAALSNILVRSLSDDTGDVSIEAASHGIARMYNSKMAEIAEVIRPDRLGVRKQYQLIDDLSAELHGKFTGNSTAQKAGKEIAAMLEDIRLRFNRAGGQIAKRGDWAMPHGSNAQKMSKTTRHNYVEQTLPLLNRHKMKNPWGGMRSDDELRELLGMTYDEIVGGGEIGPARAIANKYQEHRELHFSDYQQYAKAFGDDNTWKVITDHVERMSREIALLERLGNNPKQAFNRLAKQMGLEENRDLQNLYTNLAGFNRPDQNVLTKYGSMIRPALSAAQLGSAILSSVADVATVSINASFNGMQWGRMLNQLSASPEGRVFAGKIGASIDWALDNVGISQRFDDVAGAAWSQRAADMVFRASGLSAWTNMLRRAHAMEFAQTLAEHAGKPLSEVEPRFRKMLESYGVDDAQWRSIGGGRKLQYKNQKYLDMTSIADEGSQVRIMAILAQEADLGVIMPDVRSRSIINQGFAEDTLVGQGLRSFGQYKQYSISIVLNNLYRYMTSKRLDVSSRIGYSTALVAATTLMGALSVQLKQIAKGRDPRPMDDPDFLKAAFLQGGGAGLIGDFFFGESTRYGNSMLATALGPTGSLFEDAFKVGKSVVEGQPDIARAARYVPGQSLFYERLVYERMVVDQLSKMANPEAFRKRSRAKATRAKNEGAPYYYPPGGSLRAPDFDNVIN